MQKQLHNEVLDWATKHEITDLIQQMYGSETNNVFLKIRALDLSYKSLQTIPSFFSHFTELQILDLSHNQLTKIPEEISRLPKLQYIDINWNPISAIPKFAEGVVVKNIYCRG